MAKDSPQKIPPQRILIVISSLGKGGAERVVSRLSHHWVKHGHEVTLALCDTRHPAYPLPPKVKILDLHAPHQPSSTIVHKALAKAWTIAQTTRRLTHHLRHHPYDHIIGFMEESNIPLIIAGCLTSITGMWSGRGRGTLSRITVSVRLSPRHMAWPYKWLLVPVLYRLPRRVVAVSQAAIKQLQSLAIPPSKLTFIPNPIPPKLAGSNPPPPRQFSKTKYILAVGRLHRQKGFDLLLRAYAGLPDTCPDLVILGEGGDRPALTRLAEVLGVGNRVHLMGAVDNPQDWYAHAEMFVLSSRYEGWPNVIMEALTYGCPVVSFDCPTGPREIIAPKNNLKDSLKNGVLVKNGDIQALTRAMHKLLADPKLRRRLATAGRIRASEFAIDSIAEKWLV